MQSIITTDKKIKYDYHKQGKLGMHARGIERLARRGIKPWKHNKRLGKSMKAHPGVVHKLTVVVERLTKTRSRVKLGRSMQGFVGASPCNRSLYYIIVM